LHTKVGERRERERKKERTHGIAVFSIFLQKFAEIKFSPSLFSEYIKVKLSYQ
jgi:hypothetical protein